MVAVTDDAPHGGSRPIPPAERHARRSLPGAAADDRVSDAGDIERGAEGVVAVLGQVHVVADAMESFDQQANAAPVVEPTVDERELGRLGLDQHRSERGPETAGGREGLASSVHVRNSYRVLGARGVPPASCYRS